MNSSINYWRKSTNNIVEKINTVYLFLHVFIRRISVHIFIRLSAFPFAHPSFPPLVRRLLVHLSLRFSIILSFDLYSQPPVCPSVSLSRLPARFCLFVRQPVCLSVCHFVGLSSCLWACLSVSFSVCRSLSVSHFCVPVCFRLSLCLSQSACLSLCLSVSLSCYLVS